jgi:8-oxo-dGTP diphosphatase
MDKPTVGIASIIFNEKDEILLLHRIGKVGDDTWGLPGGKMEKNETFEECIIREVKEECNLDIYGLKFTDITNDIMDDIDHHYVTLYFFVYNFSGELKNMEPEKCSELKWFNLNQLPTNLFLPLSNLLKKGYFDNFTK